MSISYHLYENYENALFALLMAEVAEEEGKKYLEESDKLNQDPNAEIPETLDRKCRSIIEREFRRNNRRKILRISQKIVNKVALIALISMLLISAAYALVPEVRIRTLNMLIEVSDVATSLTFGDNAGSVTSVVPISFLEGYAAPAIPRGFTITDQGSDSRSSWIEYKNDEGAEIFFNIGGSYTSMLNVDTEDADNVEQIVIFGYEGLVIEKGDRIHIVWGDTDQGKYVNVVCKNVNMDTIMDIVSNMRK